MTTVKIARLCAENRFIEPPERKTDRAMDSHCACVRRSIATRVGLQPRYARVIGERVHEVRGWKRLRTEAQALVAPFGHPYVRGLAMPSPLTTGSCRHGFSRSAVSRSQTGRPSMARRIRAAGSQSSLCWRQPVTEAFVARSWRRSSGPRAKRIAGGTPSGRRCFSCVATSVTATSPWVSQISV